MPPPDAPTALVALVPVTPATPATAAPVLAPERRRRRWSWARLAALVGARRVEAGRHRPDTLRRRGWSMFAPERRPGARWGARVR